MSEKLSDKIKNALEFSNIEIPSYITQNLSKRLREYQITALKHYLLQRQKSSTNHLMFNMATGSGKTLIMAALMLECFKNGYENFVFFVNSKAILEKTKINFCDNKSSKYLFNNEIIINHKRVKINAIENFNESERGAINIHFTTIQGLYNVLTKERENALSFMDFEEKVVFLADEAHHLNAETKQKLSKAESEIKQGWEGVISKAFSSNENNLMLEFTATIPSEKGVLDKYKDKIIYEYALKEFCRNGYSKRIFLLKYDNPSLKHRFLGAILSSLYKELLSAKEGIPLKPVVLFKSERIADSKENEKKFIEFVENIESKEIEDFYKISKKGGLLHLKGEIWEDSYRFFKQEFKDGFSSAVVGFIKANFHRNYILNVNEEQDRDKNQILLNSLEDTHNSVRVIFAVDKLDEGWDVLNLFDIVRLNGRSANKSTTTREVQLIGRGARYYPFNLKNFSEELREKRKFDNAINSPLSHLERLNYHTLNEVSFIEKLNNEMIKQGILIEEPLRTNHTLSPSARAKKLTQKYEIYYAKNYAYKQNANLFNNNKIIKDDVKDFLEYHIEIPLMQDSIEAVEEDFKERDYKQSRTKSAKFSDCISEAVFLKALNVANLTFNDLTPFNAESKSAFYSDFLANLRIKLHTKQTIKSKESQLKIALFILGKMKSFVNKEAQKRALGDFRIHKLDLGEREIFKNKEKVKESQFEWLYYDKYSLDSAENGENVFLENFMRGFKDSLDKAFNKEWIIVRNEGFSEFKIYGLNENEVVQGFEPDFILFAKLKDSDKILALQCFMEVKGAHLEGLDGWKERLLRNLEKQGIKGDGELVYDGATLGEKIHLKLRGLPFFVVYNKDIFDKSKKFENAINELLVAFKNP